MEVHSVAALDVGLGPDEVRALCRPGADVAAFADPAELALLAWVDAVAGGTGPVDPGPRAALARHFADPEMVELTLLLGVTLMASHLGVFALAAGWVGGLDGLLRPAWEQSGSRVARLLLRAS